MAWATTVVMVTAAVAAAALISATVAAAIGGQIDLIASHKVFDVTSNEREWFRILLEDADYMLIGARDRVYNVSLDDMSMTSEVNFTLDEDGRRHCNSNLRQFFMTASYTVMCNNYVRSAFRDGQNLVLCGSNGGTARCRELHFNSTTDAWSSSLSAPMLQIGSPPFAPPFPWMNFTMLRSRNGFLFTGGSMIDLQRRMLHAVYRNGSADEQMKPMLSARRTEVTVHALKTYVADQPVDSRIFPNFVGTFETDEHVYWVFSEPALEAQPFQFVTTSRVARVCKNDMSHANVPTGDYIGALSTFVTYWKATLECSVPAQHSDFGPYSYDRLGYNAFQFNTVAGSTPLRTGSVFPRRDGDQPSAIMYAVFNTDRNSIRGSAVCAYKYEAIQRPFSGPLYTLEAQDPLLASYRDNSWTWRLIEFESLHMLKRHHPAKCVNDSRLLDDNSIYPGQAMLASKVQPITSRPLFVQTDHRYLMTHIVVDWQVRALDGRYYDVLFIGTDHGELLKMVNVGRGNTDVDFVIVENRTIVPDGQTPGEMRMIDAQPGKRQRQLLVNTFETVRLVPLERCSAQTRCSSCVALRDPYCSWSAATARCLALYDGSQPEGHYQSIVDGVDSRCGPEPSAEQSVMGFGQVTARAAAEVVVVAAAATTVSSKSQVSDHVRQSLLPVVDPVAVVPQPNHVPHLVGHEHDHSSVVASSTAAAPAVASGNDLPAAVASAERRPDGAPQYSTTDLAVACVATGVLCFGAAFVAGWCASRRCDAESCKVKHLEQSLQVRTGKEADDGGAVPTSGGSKLVDEARYVTYKSNNLPPNKLNNTLTTANVVYAPAEIANKNTKAEYV